MIIWLASYPKSGNTWLRSLLSSYFFTNDGSFNFNILKNIDQFPSAPYFSKYKDLFLKPESTSKFWIKEQINIAFTGETALNQSDVNPRGHAIECRINAEDPSKNFQPSPGTIGMCHQPSGFRTRVDGAIFQGYKVTPYYDSMICKLICHGRNRIEAIQRMNRSLDEFVIEGITTTIPLHKKLLSHEKFINSNFKTSHECRT